MEVVISLITGVFSLATAFGSIYLKDYLQRRRRLADRLAAQGPKQELPPPARAAMPTDTVSPLNWWRPIAITCGGWVIGNITRALRDILSFNSVHFEVVGSLILLTLLVLALAIYHSRAATGFAFFTLQLETFAIWAGYSSGWSMVHGSAWEKMIQVNLGAWIGCAVMGGILFFMLRWIWHPRSASVATC